MCQHRANRSRGQLRGIAVAAEMTEDHPLEFPAKQLLDDDGGGGIRKMTVTRLDALLHRPGAMGIVLQQFFVVVRFDHEGVHLAQPFYHHFGRITQISDEPQRA